MKEERAAIGVGARSVKAKPEYPMLMSQFHVFIIYEHKAYLNDRYLCKAFLGRPIRVLDLVFNVYNMLRNNILRIYQFVSILQKIGLDTFFNISSIIDIFSIELLNNR